MNEKILEEISGKYKIALLTTFNFDLEYFDNSIFYKFFTNGIKDVSVFVDSEQLQESLKKQKTNLGVRYSVVPFKMNKSFHPKVVLLLDDTKAKLIVGSLNLTEKGYSSNQEIYNSFEYNKDNQENLNLIIEAYKFFQQLNQLASEHDDEIFNKASEIPFLNRNDVNGEIKFISNLENSIYDVVMKNVEGKIRKIDIAVPYYDNELSALSFIEEKNPTAEIKLYVQNEKSTFPQKLYEYYESKIFKFKKVICNESGNFYHGKVFRFVTDSASYILYGSANCTKAAFINSYSNNGNVECDILEKGTINEFDDFFFQFEEDNSEFSSYPIIEKNNKENVNFTLHTLEKYDYIKIIIKYKEMISNLQIIINGEEKKECSYTYENNKLVLIISKEITKEIGNIFELKLINLFDKTENIINCFYNDYDAISNYRNSEESDKNVAKKILFKNDIFINDVIDLMYQMPNNAADVKRIKDTKNMYIEQKSETEESQNDEEYIINEEVLLEYKKKYEEDITLNKAFHKLGNSYFNIIRDIINFDNESCITKKTSNNISAKKDEPNIEISLELSDEELEIFNRRKGKRIIKKIVNGIVTDSYKQEVSYYDYKAYIGLIYLFFDKYTDYRSTSEKDADDNNKKEYLFGYSDVAVSKYNLSCSLLDLLISEKVNVQEEKDDIILLCFQSILQKFYSIREYGLEDKYYKYNVEKIIKKLDDIYHIRDIYRIYVKRALILLNKNKKIMSDELAISEIENLFKYKSLKGLIALVNFKEEHTVTHDNNTLILDVKSSETISFVKMKLELLKNELNRYFKEKYNKRDNIDSFMIIVENKNVNLELPNPTIKITLIWNDIGFKKIRKTKLTSIEEEVIEW